MLRSLWLSFVPAALAGSMAGHPVVTGFAAGSGLVYTGGALPITSLTVDRCDGTYEVVPVDAAIDPVARDVLYLPEGSMCGLELAIPATALVTLSGHGRHSGHAFDLALAGVGTVAVEVDPPVYVPPEGAPGGPFALRLAAPDWITADSLGLGGGDVVVDSAHPLHDTLRDAIRYDAQLW